MPRFLGPKSMLPILPDGLVEAASKPIAYLIPTDVGPASALGIPAVMLTKICWAWVRAKQDGLLTAAGHIEASNQARILLEGVSEVGVVALVDEATGYQALRDKDALQAILDKYLRHELAAWSKKFPDAFYKEIFRLRGWTWRGMQVNRPGVVGTYTKNIVYARLGPGILEELERRLPKQNRGYKKNLHCMFTSNVGHPALSEHIHAVIAIMRLSPDWDTFMANLDLAFPLFAETLALPIMADLPEVAGEV